ncbi:MAG: peptidylprolyl isomerase [Labilithrix sp.]|nr:peptidylprolyl isomerase [Labilithrix sp.]MBX3220482.1 peptidylprolyl isomerase [Labilithrix sp.]
MATKATIEPNARVVLEYTLRDADDDVLDASDAEDGEPIVYVHGYGMLVPGLEKALAGLAIGDEKDVVISPEEGFGERDEELILEIDRAELPRPSAVAVGDELVAESPDGEEAIMRVIEVKADAVVLDGNHPLAGETLRYSVVVRDVRPATAEEIEEAALGFEDAAEGWEPHAHPTNGAGSGLVQLGRAPTGAKKLEN